MGISNIVQVTIRRGSKSVTRAGFGTALILGPKGGFSGVRTYSDLEAVAEDFETSDAEYKAASALFGQETKPQQIKIGKQTSKVAQVRTITPTPVNEGVYSVTINGVEYEYTADSMTSASEIVTGLIAAVNGGTEPVTASGTSTLILTADQAGIPFTLAVGTNLSIANTTPNNGPVEDLQTFAQADRDWYGLIMTSHNVEEIFIVAKWIETQRKLYYYSTDQAAAKTPADTTNIMYRLKQNSLFRTFGIWSADQANYPEAGLMGDIFTRDPGSYTAKFKTISGVTVDNLTDTEATAIKSYNGNTYTTEGGVNMLAEGIMAGGEYEDVMRFIDWLQAQIEEEVFATLVGAAKIPFTDPGVGTIESKVRAQLLRGIRVGGLAADPAPEVTVPKVADVSSGDKQSRTLPDVKFNATLAGAIHFVEIEGVVTV